MKIKIIRSFGLKEIVASACLTSILFGTAYLAGCSQNNHLQASIKRVEKTSYLEQHEKDEIINAYKNIDFKTLPNDVKDFLKLPYNEKKRAVSWPLERWTEAGIIDPNYISKRDWVILYACSGLMPDAAMESVREGVPLIVEG